MKYDSGRIRTFAPRGNLLTATVHLAGRPRNHLSTLSAIQRSISEEKNNHQLKIFQFLHFFYSIFFYKKDRINSFLTAQILKYKYIQKLY